jgi:hypothetical protein
MHSPYHGNKLSYLNTAAERHDYFVVKGNARVPLVANSATLASCLDLKACKYRRKRMNSSSTLWGEDQRSTPRLTTRSYVPFFGHHQNTLDQDALQDLRGHALK